MYQERIMLSSEDILNKEFKIDTFWDESAYEKEKDLDKIFVAIINYSPPSSKTIVIILSLVSVEGGVAAISI